MRKKSLVAMATTALVAGFLTGIASPAQAFTTSGCRFDGTSINPITYQFYSVAGVYREATLYGKSRWNEASVPGYFALGNTGVEVKVYDGNYGDGYYAAWIYSCSSDGSYVNNNSKLQWDTSASNGRTTTKKRAIAGHELGHAYGLGHIPSGSANGCKIMRSDIGYASDCSVTSPTADDRIGVNALY